MSDTTFFVVGGLALAIPVAGIMTLILMIAL